MMLEVAAENEGAAAEEEEEGKEEEAMAVVSNGRAILRGGGSAPVALEPQPVAVLAPAKPAAMSPVLRQAAAKSAEPAEPPVDTSSMGKLELKRHLKKQKQKERLLAKQAAIEEKEQQKEERRRARIALSSVPQPTAPVASVGTKRARPS
jgi:hypothetical protein